MTFIEIMNSPLLYAMVGAAIVRYYTAQILPSCT